MSVHTHVVIPLSIVLELLLTSIPMRLGHCVHPWLFGATYAVVNLLAHRLLGISDVYPVLDWQSDPGQACRFVVGLLTVGIPGFHLVACLLSKLSALIFCKSEADTEAVTGRVGGDRSNNSTVNIEKDDDEGEDDDEDEEKEHEEIVKTTVMGFSNDSFYIV